MESLEGNLLEVKSSGRKDFGIDLFLKENSKLNKYKDSSYFYDFWMDLDNVPSDRKDELREDLKGYGVRVEKENRYHEGRKKELFRVSVEPSQSNDLIRDVSNILDNRNLIGASSWGKSVKKRSYPTDWLITKGFRPFDNLHIDEETGEIIAKGHMDLNLKEAGFDIETYNRGEMPAAEKASKKILTISYVSDDKKAVLTHRDNDKISQDFERDFEYDLLVSRNEKEMIDNFVGILREDDPDMVMGWNLDNYDWRYLMNRTEKLGIEDLNLGRNGEKVVKRRGGKDWIYHMPGRIEVDLMQFIPRIYDLPDNTLDSSAKKFLGEDIPSIGAEVYKYWESDEKRPILHDYSFSDSKVLKEISEELEIPDLIVYGSWLTGELPEFFTRKKHSDLLDLMAKRLSYENDGVLPLNNNFSTEFSIGEPLIDNKNSRINSKRYSLWKPILDMVRDLKREGDPPYTGPAGWLAGNIRKEMNNLKENGEGSKSKKKFLESLSLSLPELIFSKKYPWSMDYERDKREQKFLEKLGNNILDSVDEKYIFFSNEKEAVIDTDFWKEEKGKEKEGYPTITWKDGYIQIKENQIYSRGIRLFKRDRPSLLNQIIRGSIEKLASKGREEFKNYLVEEFSNFREKELEEFIYEGWTRKDPMEYENITPKIAVALYQEKEPFEIVRYGFQGEPLEKGDPVPEEEFESLSYLNYMNEVLEVLRRPFMALIEEDFTELEKFTEEVEEEIWSLETHEIIKRSKEAIRKNSS